MSKKKETLEPPDLERCQTAHRGGSFMTLGPRSWIRCEAVPTVVAYEKKPGPDGQYGSMSLCDEHLKVLQKEYPDRARVKKIVTIRTVKGAVKRRVT